MLAEGRPVPVLLRHADDALLLALGRRLPGAGAPPGLGPVARDCVRNAHCPVVTVPEPRTTPARRDLPSATYLETTRAAG